MPNRCQIGAARETPFIKGMGRKCSKHIPAQRGRKYVIFDLDRKFSL